VVGTVNPDTGHVHLSEVSGSRYLNPLRLGGRMLSPWRDSAPPVLGRPIFGRRGVVLIKGFDPQSVGGAADPAPVLGLAGLAYRVFDRRGRRISRLRWAMRGSQHLESGLRRRVYARGTRRAYATCAALPRPCRPNWVFRLAGGLAPRLRPRAGAVYRLTAYAWDWGGNVRAIDTRVTFVRGEAFVAPRNR
jgi:hypothetical protein